MKVGYDDTIVGGAINSSTIYGDNSGATEGCDSISQAQLLVVHSPIQAMTLFNCRQRNRQYGLSNTVTTPFPLMRLIAALWRRVRIRFTSLTEHLPLL